MRNLILLCLMLPMATLGLAAEPTLELGTPTYEDGRIAVDVALRGFFDEESLASLEAGVPATLIFRWKVRGEREGWRDHVVAEGEVRNRIYFDVLEETYHLFDHRGRPLGACDALKGLTETLCQREAMVLDGIPHLKKKRTYYLEMEAALETVGKEEVRGLENWLRGDDDARESGGEGLGGLTLGVIKKMAGFTGSTVRAVSVTFHGH